MIGPLSLYLLVVLLVLLLVAPTSALPTLQLSPRSLSRRLGDAVKETFLKREAANSFSSSRVPLRGGSEEAAVVDHEPPVNLESYSVLR